MCVMGIAGKGVRAGWNMKEGGFTKFRNMIRSELLTKHDATWRSNGMNNLVYTLPVDRTPVPAGQQWEQILVDLCGEDDPDARKMVEE